MSILARDSMEHVENVPHLLPELSVVVPLFNERENLPILYRRLKESLDSLGCRYELVFVNDGSRDATPALLAEIVARDAATTAVHLSRNFGHQAAVTAGLAQAQGQAVVVMDGDLQDPPEVLPQFVAMWRQGFDVVYAIREKRKENLFKRAAYYIFYRLLRAVSDISIPLDSGDFCLMDRKVVDALQRLPEKDRFVRGLRAFVGFRQIGLAYERAARLAGKPKYTFRRLARLAIDGLVSFSTFPLHLVTYLGLGTGAVALAWAAWLLVQVTLGQTGPDASGAIVAVVLFMSAVQLLSLGIVGQYVQRIFLEVKGRPTFVIERVDRQEAGEVLRENRETAVWAGRVSII